MKTKVFFLFFAATLLPFITGCHDQIDSPPTDTVGWTKPGIGTYYTFRSLESSYKDTITLTKKGVSGFGKNDLYQFTSGDDETLLLSYESNGDISAYGDEANIVLWKTMPTGSHKQVIYEYDSTFVDQTRQIIRDTVTYVGEEDLLLTGIVFKTIHIKELSHYERYDHGTVVGIGHQQYDTWTAPSIGFQVFTYQFDQSLGSTGKIIGEYSNTKELTSYLLKP